jgi:hypothetical protein
VTPCVSRAAAGRILPDVKLTRGKSLFLLAFGVWSWFIWVMLVVNVSQDPRAFSAGAPTAFLYVHCVLAVISIALGTTIGVFGLRGLCGVKEKADVSA